MTNCDSEDTQACKIRLSDLVDLPTLEQRIADRYVNVRADESGSLRIYNYTDSCQYDRVWDDVTRQCRGLIVRGDGDGEVVARPFRKFFNHGQPEAPQLDPSAPVLVSDKVDGSLGILYRDHMGEHAIATRGSFVSDQALHATELYRREYAADWTPREGWTYLFEIVYPGNRIVLDYGGRDALILLGAVRKSDGYWIGPWDPDVAGWPGSRADEFKYATLADALAAKPRANAEGMVVRFADTLDDAVKIKQADYMALHKLIFALSERAVWERLGAGDTAADICDGLPDEFHSWVIDVAARLLTARDAEIAEARHEFMRVSNLVGTTDRKAFARAAQSAPSPAWLFLLLDGRETVLADKVWYGLRPAGDSRMTHQSEDVA